MPITERSYYDASQKGRADAQNEVTNNLRQQGLSQELQNNVLRQQAAQQDSQAAQVKDFATQMHAASQYGLQQPPGQTKAFVQQNFPQLVEKYGPDWNTATDDQVRQQLQGFQAQFGAQLGQGPAPAPIQYETVKGPRGSVIQRNPQTNEQKQVVGPDNSQPAPRPAQAPAPSGFRWKVDGTLEAIPGGPADKNDGSGGLGGREGVMFQRVINSANSAAAALQNISELPVGASTGVLGIGTSPGHSVMASVKSMLLNKLASQDVQDYNTMLAGVSRNLSTIETAGLAPNGSITASMDSINLREGDTELTKLRKLAEMRQIISKGIEANLANPRLPKEQKDLVRGIMDQVEKSIPFTQSDITQLRARQAKNPDFTLQDLIAEKGLGATKATATKATATTAASTAPVQVKSDAEYASLKSGTRYIAPDGSTRVKK